MFAMALYVEAQQTSYDSQLITNDTLTNTDTITHTAKLLSTVYYGSVQIVCDSLTGAPAGTAYLQGSNNGTNWTTLQTLSLNGAGTYDAVWSLNPGVTKYIRVYILGTGTATIKCNAYLRLVPVRGW